MERFRFDEQSSGSIEGDIVDREERQLARLDTGSHGWPVRAISTSRGFQGLKATRDRSRCVSFHTAVAGSILP